MTTSEYVEIRGTASRRNSLDDLQKARCTLAMDQYALTSFVALAAGPYDWNASSNDGPSEAASPPSRRTILPFGLEHRSSFGDSPTRFAGGAYLKCWVAVGRKFRGLEQLLQFTSRTQGIAPKKNSR